jgi:hypothetical protein
LIEGFLVVVFGNKETLDYYEEFVTHISLVNYVAACLVSGLFQKITEFLEVLRSKIGKDVHIHQFLDVG